MAMRMDGAPLIKCTRSLQINELEEEEEEEKSNIVVDMTDCLSEAKCVIAKEVVAGDSEWMDEVKSLSPCTSWAITGRRQWTTFHNKLNCASAICVYSLIRDYEDGFEI